MLKTQYEILNLTLCMTKLRVLMLSFPNFTDMIIYLIWKLLSTLLVLLLGVPTKVGILCLDSLNIIVA
jgi:hypothetical protein